MTDLTLTEANDLKVQHARDICNAALQLKTVIDSQNHLYFGGLPATLEAIKNVIHYQCAELAKNVGVDQYYVSQNVLPLPVSPIMAPPDFVEPPYTPPPPRPPILL